jgi:cathepsin A (carboxypeptidase C)
MNNDSLELDNKEINEEKKLIDIEEGVQTHHCVSDGYIEYLKNPEVLKAIHVSPKSMEWESCNYYIAVTYVRNYDNMRKQLLEINKSKLKTIIYNGEFDMVSNFVGQQRFLDSLNIPIVKESTNWLNNGITAGYVKYFANNLIFTSIRNSGHFAPKDNPETCLKLLRVFLGKDVF